MAGKLTPAAQTRLRKLVGVLGTDNENERLVALRAIENLLQAHGWRLHELLQAAGDPTLADPFKGAESAPNTNKTPPPPRSRYDADPHNPFRSDAGYGGDPHTRQMLDEMLDEPGSKESINTMLRSISRQWVTKGRISEAQREAVRSCWNVWSEQRRR